MAKVIVLFEDARESPKGAALDRLIWASVADELGRDLWSLKADVEVRMMKGNGNLLEDIKRLDAVAPSGEVVFAVLDDDEIHAPLKLKKGAPRAAVVKAITKLCDHPSRLRVVLMSDNMESLLEGIRKCLATHGGATLTVDAWARAIDRKVMVERDRALDRAAFAPSRAVRDCVRSALASFGDLIAGIAGCVA